MRENQFFSVTAMALDEVESVLHICSISRCSLRHPLAFDAMLYNPWMFLYLIQRYPLLRVEDKQLQSISISLTFSLQI
jgi:hypothetical protein